MNLIAAGCSQHRDTIARRHGLVAIGLLQKFRSGPAIKKVEMTMVHSIPNAFSADECERIIAAIASSAVDEAFLIGHNREKNLRNAELVWIDEVRGMEWAMERLIDVVRKSNTNHYDFDIREFAESPQVASYNASIAVSGSAVTLFSGSSRA